MAAVAAPFACHADATAPAPHFPLPPADAAAHSWRAGPSARERPFSGPFRLQAFASGCCLRCRRHPAQRIAPDLLSSSSAADGRRGAVSLAPALHFVPRERGDVDFRRACALLESASAAACCQIDAGAACGYLPRIFHPCLLTRLLIPGAQGPRHASGHFRRVSGCRHLRAAAASGAGATRPSASRPTYFPAPGPQTAAEVRFGGQ